MHNPFEDLLRRFDRLESLLQERMPFGNSAASLPDIGGLSLAQEITRLSKQRLYGLVSARAIPHKKRGNRLYFNRAELLAWVAEGNRAERKQKGC